MKIDIDRIHRLASAIVKIRIGRASDSERSLVLDWLDESPENRALYRDIIRFVSAGRRIRLEEQVQSETDFTMVRDSVVEKLKTARTARNRRLRIASGGAVAAAAAAVLLLIGGISRTAAPDTRQVADYGNGPSPTIELVLPSGGKVDVENSELTIEELLASDVASQVLRGEDTSDGSTVISRLITQRGGQAEFTLEDGTKVWLNTLSELDFPAAFGTGPRIVRLTGEACFDVAADAGRPFIVEAGGVSVRALGTSFNVQAYADEPEIATTLVSGSVEVTPVSGAERIILRPGMQSLWNRESGMHTSSAVSAGEITAWRDGEFFFTEKPLATVLRTLARWYDIEFVHPPGSTVKHTLTGKSIRTNTLEQSLQMITDTGGPLFEIKGNKAFILER